MPDELKPCPACGQPPFSRHAVYGPEIKCKNPECFLSRLLQPFKAYEWQEQPYVDTLRAELSAAQKTLEGLGYTYHGGELWKPPLGRAPGFALVDRLNAKLEAAKEALTPSAETKTAYMSEVKNGDSFVSWTAIKEIMRMIRTRWEAVNGRPE